MKIILKMGEMSRILCLCECNNLSPRPHSQRTTRIAHRGKLSSLFSMFLLHLLYVL